MSTPCPPLSDEEWPGEIADLLPGFAGRLNVYRVMARHPALLRAWAPLRAHLVTGNRLGRERSEVAILRVGHRMGADYEWQHHVGRARALGFSDARIAAVRGEPGGEDGVIVRAVDAVVDTHRLPPGLEAELAALTGREAVMDLIALVGFYATLAALISTYDVPLDDDVSAELAARPFKG